MKADYSDWAIESDRFDPNVSPARTLGQTSRSSLVIALPPLGERNLTAQSSPRGAKRHLSIIIASAIETKNPIALRRCGNPKRPQTVDGMKNLHRAIAASISSCHVFVDVILHSDADSIIHISTTR